MLIKFRKIKIARIFIYILLILIAIICIGCFLLYNFRYEKKFDNSYYNSKMISNKTVMFIVPHQDDDTNFAGSTISNYAKAGSKVIVVFGTNGDCYGLGKTRIKEAIKVLKSLGVSEENIIFLGYGDVWKSKLKNIYNVDDDEIVTSRIGRTETYGIKGKPDFRTSISGVPSIYTKANYRQDIKDVILKYKPETIFCSDFDIHPEHRTVSLLFEEAMEQILKEDIGYTPTVYKGFGYNTAWDTIDDYYNINLKSSLKPRKDCLNNSLYELDNPTYNWKDRVRLPVSKDALSYVKRANNIYKASIKYKSQNTRPEAGKILNSDQVFFERKTKSYTYKASIEVSSGVGKYLNDFKFIDSSNIYKQHVDFDDCVWTPEKDDLEKKLKITFDSPKDINLISLYDNFSVEDNILSGTLTFSDGSEIKVGNLNKNGSETKINFDLKKNITYVEFKINEYEGENPGLVEIEAYNEKNDTDAKFIKIINNNDTEDFIYRYFVTDENEISLGMYTYPKIENFNLNEKYKLYIKEATDDNVTLQDNKVIIKDNKSPGKYIIRAELIDDPSVYDEIEIYIPTTYESSYLLSLMKFEQILDFFRNLFD